MNELDILLDAGYDYLEAIDMLEDACYEDYGFTIK